MEKLYIIGGKRLSGSIKCGGMKNAADPIFFATLLVGDVCTIENVPDAADIHHACDILRSLGAVVAYKGDNVYQIDTRFVDHARIDGTLSCKLRSSYYLLGAGLGRFGTAETGYPGGCDFGSRPIDQHVKGFRALGARVEENVGEDQCIRCQAPDGGLTGSSIYLDVPSVGATINIMLAACTAKGTTIIDNAAREPHIVDVASFLNSCGADIVGAGTPTIKINGVPKLYGSTYAVVPDMIEAGTYMIAAAATGSEIVVENVIPRHLESLTAKLKEMGVSVEEGDDCITIHSPADDAQPLHPVRVKAAFYPGFPTDLQPQIAVLLCLAKGESMLTESVWSNRFQYVPELLRMGAKITVSGSDATITGVSELRAANVRAVDLRAGAAMVIAALTASGTTVVDDIHHILRGYENIVEKLNAVGADIRLVSLPDAI
ncbi:MAG: UDP-N-acetylglucosamine 1-carboxyvinyltransferase [Oscillospiraceae bacterium]|nr:UDP-N-acetylglucosamine 1-carboxyvinyltransferase [Oscillospiraceae bacterium]